MLRWNNAYAAAALPLATVPFTQRRAPTAADVAELNRISRSSVSVSERAHLVLRRADRTYRQAGTMPPTESTQHGRACVKTSRDRISAMRVLTDDCRRLMQRESYGLAHSQTLLQQTEARLNASLALLLESSHRLLDRD
jgi:hypothetical protein